MPSRFPRLLYSYALPRFSLLLILSTLSSSILIAALNDDKFDTFFLVPFQRLLYLTEPTALPSDLHFNSDSILALYS